MKTISVQGDRPYSVAVGGGLLASAGDAVRRFLPEAEKIALVTDDNVELLWADRAEDALRESGAEVYRFVLPQGEQSKTPEHYLALLAFLAEEGFSRTDAVAALGGGVVSDLAGFAAATYLRGISYVTLPTTLLAMVDAAVGGKTGVNLPAGKNAVGAFWAPAAVLCDTETLNTLPRQQFTEGCAEVLKYAVLTDRPRFVTLLSEGRDFDRTAVIADCIAVKASFAAADERDLGRRKLLNLGHTLGHALEAKSGFSLGHGSAVAMGMAAVARAAAANGICDAACADAIAEGLRELGLPTELPCTAEELLPFLLRDKKRRGSRIDLIVPEAIGACRILTLPAAKAGAWLKAGERP